MSVILSAARLAVYDRYLVASILGGQVFRLQPAAGVRETSR